MDSTDFCSFCGMRQHSEKQCEESYMAEYNAWVEREMNALSEEFARQTIEISEEECREERMGEPAVCENNPFLIRNDGSSPGQKTEEGKGWSHFTRKKLHSDSDSAEPDDKPRAKRMKIN